MELYDYGARFYDPAIARFMTQDRFAEKYFDFSPYQYGANNPISNIDINGDSIWVTVTNQITNQDGSTSLESNRYYYGTDSDGNKGFLGSDGNLYNGNNQFINDVSAGLKKLSSKSTGRALVNELANSEKNTEIAYMHKNEAGKDGSYVFWNPNKTAGGPDQSGNNTRKAFIGLGHELAHVRDAWNGSIDMSKWENTSIPNAEKYATHVENQIRAEHGVSLRTHYAINSNGKPNSATRIINSNGVSLFYTQTKTTTIRQPLILGGTPPSAPVIIQTVDPYKY